jgi:hypothetical protein
MFTTRRTAVGLWTGARTYFRLAGADTLCRLDMFL